MNTTNTSQPGRMFSGRRAALIIPPSPFLLDERVFVSLGVLRVAASLESQGVIVDVLDLSGVGNYDNAVASYCSTTDVEWIGITCTTPQLPAAVVIGQTIRKQRPDIKLVLGGPHVTLTCSAVKIEQRNQNTSGRAHRALAVLQSYFDILVAGDGELAVFELFRTDCPAIIDGDDHRGQFFLSDRQYEQLPWPARHLVDLTSYHYSIEGRNATSLISQLGCPFNCGFCGGRNSRSLRVIRTRSSQSILDEIRWLYQTYGYTGFMFYDDELNINRQFTSLMDQLCDLQRTLNVQFRLRGFIKAELFSKAQAESMYRAGFRWILSGFEAAHPRILTNINKRATLEDNARVIEIAHKYGLKVKALMSVGHPGETRETILAIRDWLIKSQVDDFDCTVITTYPGTPYYDLAVPHTNLPNVWTYTHPETGDRLHAYELDYTQTADYYKGDPDGGYQAYVFTDHLSAKEIVDLRDQVERDVRSTLGIPYPGGSAAIKYEHSMGQGLPDMIYKSCSNAKPR